MHNKTVKWEFHTAIEDQQLAERRSIYNIQTQLCSVLASSNIWEFEASF